MNTTIDITSKHTSQFQLPVSKKIKRDETITKLPVEMVMEIFSNLHLVDLLRASNSCRYWKNIEIEHNLLNKFVYNYIAFGKDKWIKYFGEEVVKNDQEDFKALPKDIVKVLLTRVPETKERVMDSQVLFWIPKQIKGKDLNIQSLGQLLKERYFPNTDDGYEFCTKEIEQLSQRKKESLNQSYWNLMTKKVLPNSKDECYRIQCFIVKDFAEETGIEYDVPGVLEATVCIFAEFVRSGGLTRLFGNNPETYTRCRQQVRFYNNSIMDYIVVGDFSPSGLRVGYGPSDRIHNCGVAALKKFIYSAQEIKKTVTQLKWHVMGTGMHIMGLKSSF